VGQSADAGAGWPVGAAAAVVVAGSPEEVGLLSSSQPPTPTMATKPTMPAIVATRWEVQRLVKASAIRCWWGWILDQRRPV